MSKRILLLTTSLLTFSLFTSPSRAADESNLSVNERIEALEAIWRS